MRNCVRNCRNKLIKVIMCYILCEDVFFKFAAYKIQVRKNLCRHKTTLKLPCETFITHITSLPVMFWSIFQMTKIFKTSYILYI